MKAMDEFGSVLALTTLVLGLCAAVDGVFSAGDAGSARSAPSNAEYGADRSIQFAKQEIADPGFSVEWTAAVLAAPADSRNSAAPLPLDR